MIDREERVREVFELVWDRAAGERERALSEACADDDALRAQVLDLLQAHAEAGDFLETPPFLTGSPDDYFAPTPDFTGRRIGPYELQYEIGRGGMSSVYLASRVDDEYRRQVAVKLIWPSPDTEEVIRRFKQERQILADLDHPNIARLLDGGTAEDGRPYIVMEYIEGQPITAYCDERRLSINERLKLFQTVCDAVEYAHRNLVIHRDLKPGNILVTEEGVVKLLDFGVAKLLTPEPGAEPRTLTRTGWHWMTPEYASPEQMRGEPVTLASDVYSLGALLYELLTGAHPHDLRNHPLHEMMRIVNEEDPRPPSARTRQPGISPQNFSETSADKMRRRLRGDLDNIALMALRKDPRLRYSTAEQLISDIERRLTRRPIRARPPTISYRAGKFAQRHSVGVAVAVTALLMIIAGLILALRQAYAEGERARREYRMRYAGQMQQTMRDWEAGNLPRLLETLESYQRPEDEHLRGFEWRYLWRLSHREKMTLPQAGYGMAISPDGNKLATGRNDGSVVLWDLTTGQQIKLFKGHTEGAFYMAFSPDGTKLLTGSYDRTAKVWEVATGRELATLKGHTDNIFSVAYSPDGRRISTGGSDRAVRLWDAVNYRQLFVFTEREDPDKSPVVSLFAPDGKTLATVGYFRIGIWDAATGRLLSTIKNDEDTPEVIALPTGERIVRRARINRLGSPAFSPDGRLIAATSGALVKVWNISTGRKVATLNGHHDALTGDGALAFSPDGRLLASGGVDRMIILWDTATWRELITIKGIGTEVNTVAFSPDSHTLVSGGANQTVKLWDVDAVLEPTVLRVKSDEVFGVTFTRDGRMVVTGDNAGAVRVWDVTTGGVRTFAGHVGTVRAVASSPDGRLVATASDDKTVKLWDVTTGRTIATLEGHDGDVRAVAFSNDGRRIATGGDDQTARIWEIATTRNLATFESKPLAGWSGVWSVAFSPDDKLLATGHQNGPARLWDIAAGRELAALAGQGGGVWATRFSPDGRLLAAGAGDSTVKLWEVATRHELATLRGHADEVFSLAFSPDGRRLATASNDKTVKLWDVETAQELISLNGHTDQVRSVAFSPDGKMLVSGGFDGVARIWRAASREEVEARGGNRR